MILAQKVFEIAIDYKDKSLRRTMQIRDAEAASSTIDTMRKQKDVKACFLKGVFWAVPWYNGERHAKGTLQLMPADKVRNTYEEIINEFHKKSN